MIVEERDRLVRLELKVDYLFGLADAKKAVEANARANS